MTQITSRLVSSEAFVVGCVANVLLGSNRGEELLLVNIARTMRKRRPFAA